MKPKNNHVEVMMFSKVVAARYSQSEILKRFTAFIQPALEQQEANAKKFFPGTLRNISPVYLS